FIDSIQLTVACLLAGVLDAYGVGMATLVVNALGSDPASSDSTFAPLVDTVEDGNGESYVSFSYTENKAVQGVNYVIEKSVDLKTWEPVDLSTATVNRLDRSTFTQVTVYIPSSGGSNFFRVQVIK
ncbi:MAG: hypothetical protein VW879_09235, partial [Opitutae bacterium]